MTNDGALRLTPAIGQSIARVDGPTKVTGRARYTADVPLEGMLWGAVLRSPFPHARIVRIDVSAARQMQGVHAVLTGHDLPPHRVGKSIVDIPVLARDRVLFIGDRVAAVAAVDHDTAEAALRSITVEYEELPAVFDPLEAMAPGAPVLHPDFSKYQGIQKDLPPVPNLASAECMDKGNIDEGFAESDLVMEHTYRFPMQHQGYVEPHTCIVSCEPDGTVRVWASNKSPFVLRDQLARQFGLDQSAVVVEWAYVGGDFGGKGSLMELPTAYVLSRATARPVKIVLSTVEEFTAANPRHAAIVTIRTGVSRDGHLHARHVQIVFDSGAYAGYKPLPGGVLPASHWSAGVYRIPHVRFESRMVYTNHVPGGHMRAPGGAQATFAGELDIDRIAATMAMDPLRFRQLNAVEEGDVGPLGEEWRSARVMECLREVELRAGWHESKGPNVGRGIALSHCAGGFGGSAARVEAYADGRVRLHTGVSDQGAGSHTVLMQIVADELQIPVSLVDLNLGSTGQSPWDSGSSASRVTYVAGTATQRAAVAVREKLRELAGEFLGCSLSDVELGSAGFSERERSENVISLDDLLKRAVDPSAPVVGEHRFVDYDPISTPSFGAQAVELEVDRETGAYKIRRIVGAHDVGTVLHPIGVSGQIEGGTIQALSAGAMEELPHTNGKIGLVSLGDYKLPTCMDVPPFESVLVTDGPGIGPYGAKPIGELTNTMLPAAIANAVYDAVGVWITELPVTAEKIHAALLEKST